MMPPMTLGVVLAGGMSTRFGSDKALAEYRGHTLLAHAVDLLSGWCEHVIVAGRAEAPAPTVPDHPRPGMGPLGGLLAALRDAADEGYAGVLSIGVDTLDLPADLPDLLGPAPAYLATQPVVGHWRPEDALLLEELLAGDGSHAMMAFAEACGARAVTLPTSPANINTPADLAQLEQRGGG
jgi:molybdenum cofactor guanylyltransferase